MTKQRMLHRLPVEAYTSRDWFDREQEMIFSRTWRYAGFAEDISEPGQYISVQAGLNNIFIVMGRDRRLRAFHNICRHRGTQLLRAVGKTQKAITCPYHDWTYDLEGKLISVPDEATEYPKGIDKACLGLKPASVDIWRGMLFVHPDPETGSIMKWFGEVEPHLGPHKPEELVEYPAARQTYEIKANWKIAVENFIDVYHLSHLHSNTLHMYDHAKAEYGFVGPHYAFWEPPSVDYAADQDKKLPTPRIVPQDMSGAWVPMLFPGIGLGESESDWSIFIITPLAPDLTRIENRTKVANASTWEFSKQALRSGGFWSGFASGKYEAEDAAGEDDPMASGDFTAEDVYACEQQQKSLQSPHFEVGPASVGESPVTDHQQVVLDWLEKIT
ncbi:MAG: aromatic ring-hydroxylating oxygenase subunit alpha [Rhizobiaceae bacterium]